MLTELRSVRAGLHNYSFGVRLSGYFPTQEVVLEWCGFDTNARWCQITGKSFSRPNLAKLARLCFIITWPPPTEHRNCPFVHGPLFKKLFLSESEPCKETKLSPFLQLPSLFFPGPFVLSYSTRQSRDGSKKSVQGVGNLTGYIIWKNSWGRTKVMWQKLYEIK